MLTLALRIFDRVRGHMRAVRSRRSRILSVRALDSLPESLRRDIGWPDRYVGLAADDEWSVPINLTVSKLVMVGKQPVSFSGGPRYWAVSPDNGPDGWGIRAGVSLLFPK